VYDGVNAPTFRHRDAIESKKGFRVVRQRGLRMTTRSRGKVWENGVAGHVERKVYNDEYIQNLVLPFLSSPHYQISIDLDGDYVFFFIYINLLDENYLSFTITKRSEERKKN